LPNYKNDHYNAPNLGRKAPRLALASLDREIALDEWIMAYPDFLDPIKYFQFRPFFKDIGGVGVEIGSFEGYNALGIMTFTKTEKLYCIDPYKAYTCPVGEYMGKFTQEDWDEIFERTKKKLEGKNVEFIRKPSLDARDDVPDNLDWVYIDGLHTSASVFNDLTYWETKVKAGGRIGGHDATEAEVQVGLREWLIVNKLPDNVIKLNGNEWWITKC